jgi:DNA-binding transcriptional LysR family regulator
MTLKQLEAFYWAVVSSNFVVAAARLHVSQSTLSKRIVELEARIGQPLFDRSGQRAVPTEAAQALLPLARRMLRMAEEMRTMFRGEQWLRGHCRFGVGEFSALTWLPDFVAYSRAAWPEVVLEPFVDLGAALEQRLDAGELDFAVIAGLSSRTALSGETIGKVHFSWGASPEVVGSRRSVSAELLQDVTLITMPPGAGATRVLDQWLATYDIEVGRRVTCNNLAAIAGLVAAGVGISLFPRGWLDRMIDRDAVVEMRSPHPLPALSYTFQYRRGDTRLLLRHMRQAVAATVDFSKPHALW